MPSRSNILPVEHIATTGRMFEREGITQQKGQEILTFLKQNRDELREFSLRTAMKVCQLMKSHPQDWMRMSRVLLCR